MSSLIIDSKIEIEKWLDDFISSSSEYFDNYDDLVEDIIANVKENGDEALISLTHKFDNVQLEKATLFFSEQEIRSSSKKILAKEKEALNLAASRIKKYHIKQLPKNKFWKDEKGVNLGFRWTPINSIGIYVPGGLASYPSSVLMNAIPAKVAGVRNITMVTPTPLGKINPLVLYAAKIAGVDKIVKIGGAQAIAALAYGTESIDAVDKIVGPGNSFVAAAKRKVFGQVGIDSVAGPSEVLIISDSDQNPSWIAADLLAQAEHDEKAKSILITDNITFAKAVELEVWKLLSNLKDNTVASKSWSENGKILVVNQLKDNKNWFSKLTPGGFLIISYPTKDCFPEWKDTCKKIDIEYSGLNFLCSKELLKDFKSTEIHYSKQFNYLENFEDVYKLFRSIKNVGAQSTNCKRKTVKELKEIQKFWPKNYNNTVNLSWQIEIQVIKKL